MADIFKIWGSEPTTAVL